MPTLHHPHPPMGPQRPPWLPHIRPWDSPHPPWLTHVYPWDLWVLSRGPTSALGSPRLPLGHPPQLWDPGVHPGAAMSTCGTAKSTLGVHCLSWVSPNPTSTLGAPQPYPRPHIPPCDPLRLAWVPHTCLRGPHAHPMGSTVTYETPMSTHGTSPRSPTGPPISPRCPLSTPWTSWSHLSWTGLFPH